MRLQKIQVTSFRSVDDSEEFDVDPVTCLVGKNEAGKSAILLALAALNPNEATPVTLDKERDYPRRNLVRYKQIHGNEDAVVIRTIWELDEGEIQVIAKDVGEDVLMSPLVKVSRRYGKKIAVSAQLNYSATVKHHFNLFALNASERSMLKSPKTTDQLIEALNSLQSPTEKHLQLQQYLSERGNATTRVRDRVICALPSFMYVSSYDRMDGAIQIEETRQRIEAEEIDYHEHRGSRLFVDFLEYAGVEIDAITKVSTYETFNAMLQAASTNITEQILEYWSQNPDLDVEVRIDEARPGDLPPFNQGTIARARIKNNLHRVDTPLSERSAGFVWFFSFLVKFAQVKNTGGPVVLLLDEPGLSLHGKAQGDLLRFIDDKLAPSHQVIYSTHSGRDVRIDGLRWDELHDSGSRGLNLAAHVERRDLEEEPLPEPVAVLERGRPHRIGHRVRPEARVPPLGEPLEPVDLGLLHLVRLLDGLIGEHLRHGGVDPALGQRGSDLRLLERRVRQVPIRGQVVERVLRALDGRGERGRGVHHCVVEHALAVGGLTGLAVVLHSARRRLGRAVTEQLEDVRLARLVGHPLGAPPDIGERVSAPHAPHRVDQLAGCAAELGAPVEAVAD